MNTEYKLYVNDYHALLLVEADGEQWAMLHDCSPKRSGIPTALWHLTNGVGIEWLNRNLCGEMWPDDLAEFMETFNPEQWQEIELAQHPEQWAEDLDNIPYSNARGMIEQALMLYDLPASLGRVCKKIDELALAPFIDWASDVESRLYDSEVRFSTREGLEMAQKLCYTIAAILEEQTPDELPLVCDIFETVMQAVSPYAKIVAGETEDDGEPDFQPSFVISTEDLQHSEPGRDFEFSYNIATTAAEICGLDSFPDDRDRDGQCESFYFYIEN